MRKRYGTSFGCLDLILAWMVIGSFIFIFSGSRMAGSQAGTIIGGIFWIVVAGFWFAWRRGWVQRYRDDQKAKEQAERAAALQRQAEAKQYSAPTTTPQPAATSNGGEEPVDFETDYEPIDLPFFKVTVPISDKLSATQAAGLTRTLIAKAESGVLVFALVGTRKGVTWQIGHLSQPEVRLTGQALTELVNAYYPGASVEQLKEPILNAPLFRRYHIFKPKAQRYFDEALSISDLGRDDPLMHLARALTELEDGETLTYAVTVFGIATADEKEIERVLTVSAHEAGYRYQSSGGFSGRNWEEAIGYSIGAGVANEIRNQFLKGKRVQLYSDAETRHFLEKLTQPLAQCVISVTLDTPKAERLSALEHRYGAVRGLESQEIKLDAGYTSPDIRITQQDDWWLRQAAVYIEDLVPKDPKDPDLVSQYLFAFTVDELAAYWHLPHRGSAAGDTMLEPTDGVQVPVPAGLTFDPQGILVGENRFGARKTPVYLPTAERTAHTVIIGKTGRGKSSLIHRMLHQDIAAGRGVCLIDPKGTLVERVLQHSIPPGREDDVVVIDVRKEVGGVFYPPPLNLFVSGKASHDMAARRLQAIFATQFKEFAGHKMADTLNMVLQTLYQLPNPTLLDLNCLLNDPDFRAKVTAQVRNPVVTQFWKRFEDQKSGAQEAQTDPILWRVRSFINNEHLQVMTCHPDRLDLKQMVADKRIILVSLGADEELMPKEERYVLGAALLSQLDQIARQKVVRDDLFMIYVDEAQEFVGTALPSMLSQLREYNVGLVLANQYFGQFFSDTTLQAIEGNVSTLIAFEVGKEDANRLLPYMEPGFTDNALVALGKYRAAVSMLDAYGRRVSAFTLDTLAPPGDGTTDLAREQLLRRRSVERLGWKPYDEVLNWTRERYAICDEPAFDDAQEAPTTPDGHANGEFFEPTSTSAPGHPDGVSAPDAGDG